jgi:hypothetical protein
VTAIAADNVWVVGYNGIRHWVGTGWNTSWQPSRAALLAVSASSATDVWAVGTPNPAAGGSTIFHRTSVPNYWTAVTSPTTAILYSVDAVLSNDAWAVGQSGAIIHWDGASWVSVTSPTSNLLRSVAMSSASDGWAVGPYGTFLRWNGSSWVQVASPTTDSLLGVAMSSTSNGWAVGSVMLHWDGAEWKTFDFCPNAVYLPLVIRN